MSEVADHGKVRVTLSDGDQESIYDPWVEADSLKGRQHIETLAFPVDQVAALESHSTNEAGTALAIFGGLVAVVMVAGLIECAAGDGGYGCPFQACLAHSATSHSRAPLGPFLYWISPRSWIAFTASEIPDSRRFG